MKRQTPWKAPTSRDLDKLSDCTTKLILTVYSTIARRFNKPVFQSADAIGDLRTFLGLVVVYLIFTAVAGSAINTIAHKSSKAIIPNLLPSFAIENPTSYQALLVYVELVFFSAGLVGLSWVRIYFPIHRLVRSLNPFSLGITAAIGLISIKFSLSEVFFALAIFGSFLFWALNRALKVETSFENSAFSKAFYWALNCVLKEAASLANSARIIYWLRIAPSFLVTICAVSVYVAALGWYPITIPSDYYELSDQTYISSALSKSLFSKTDERLSESEAIQCLIEYNQKSDAKNMMAYKNENMPKAPSDSLLTKNKCSLSSEAISNKSALTWPLHKIANWQVQAGRLLYHHSYVFVPARNFLTYGFNSTVEYRYGYGNTLFHAALLAIEPPTLTTYFNTYPIAQLFGLIAIALVVFYATRNIFAAIAGFSLAFGALDLIDPSILRLAVGFSSLRYFGLCVQIISIFYLFRGDETKRSSLISFAMLFSFFWNKEFALLGAVGQAFALLSPSLNLKRSLRLIQVAFLTAMTIVLICISSHYSDFSQNQFLSFFGVGVPDMGKLNLFYYFVFTLTALSLININQFNSRERDARLSLFFIMLFALIKYLFYPIIEHFYYSVVLIGPMLLIFYPWTVRWQKRDNKLINKRVLEYWFSFALVLLSLIQAARFSVLSSHFDGYYIAPLVTGHWQTMGESFVTPIPETPIAKRIEAIKSVMKQGDKVLLLSPFDHLISFYANPQHYCGHFELLTNLVTRSSVEQTLRCARNSDNLLIIYDKALEIGCPDDEAAEYFHRPSCMSKFGLKTTMRQIMQSLEPNVTLVQEIGDLKFYRINSLQREKL